MATSDQELIAEVRDLTDYHTDIMSDSQIQGLIDIGKEELRARFNDPDFQFYQTGNQHTHSADRALFWFTCIAAKVKAGEIAGINITVDDIEASTSSVGQYDFWFDRFRSRVAQAEASVSAKISQSNIERDNRSYGDNA